MTLQCIPIAAIWNYMLRPIYGGTAKCLSESAFTKINVVNNCTYSISIKVYYRFSNLLLQLLC